MAAKGQSTINTVLKIGATANALTKVTPIKSYPDLFGTPDTIEITDLEDEMQKFVPGVRSADSMDFTANFMIANFKALVALQDQDLFFELDFGENGANGKFTWSGRLAVRINGGDVNAAREMTITVFPDSEITDATAAGTT